MHIKFFGLFEFRIWMLLAAGAALVTTMVSDERVIDVRSIMLYSLTRNHYENALETKFCTVIDQHIGQGMLYWHNQEKFVI